MTHAAWAETAAVYELNLRQFTPEGTLEAAAAHLPRLASLGITVVWLMPVQPVGVLNRKGPLGSPYSVRDYTAVNPELGTLDDLHRFVVRAHDLGLKVLLDWVANHTAWDHRWVTEHPDWYLKDAAGQIHSYTYDNGRELEYWTDVVGLDWRNRNVWSAMADAILFWMEEAGVDGFRCDVAGLVPTPFWEQLREKLDAVRPVLMLAEWWTKDLHDKAFDMTYDWGFYDLQREIVKGTKTAADLKVALEADRAAYPPEAYRMVFTTNHDKNSWEASDTEHLGPAFEAFAALTFVVPGVPLIYNGQEAVLDRRLPFFERGPIDWKSFSREDFFQKLLHLKKHHPALWNGLAGGTTVYQADAEGLFTVRRMKGDDRVTGVFNLSPRPRPLPATGGAPGETLPPWGYAVVPG